MSVIDLDIDQWLDERDSFELLIDARSPCEYEYSCIVGSKNYFALDDAQHKEVGTIYKTNRASAKVLGARYICLNLDKHLLEISSKFRVGAKVGVYCAKGGMRSASIAHVLGMIGYRVVRLVGGYKAYRNHVLSELNRPINMRFITLFGNTGTRKTKLINELSPSINLEKMANHLGSVFGSVSGKQPSQKAFEDALFERLRELRGVKVCFIEGESRRIGEITLPESIYKAMREDSINVEIFADIKNRINCILDDYCGVDRAFFDECMTKIRAFISKDAKDDAISAYSGGDNAKVAEILLTQYYDKVYKKPARIDCSICSDDIEYAKSKLLEISQSLNCIA